jgi:hypothetical protein
LSPAGDSSDLGQGFVRDSQAQDLNLVCEFSLKSMTSPAFVHTLIWIDHGFATAQMNPRRFAAVSKWS